MKNKIVWRIGLIMMILLLLIIPTALWIYRNVQNGTYSNMDVSNRKQRHSLYIFIIIATVIFLAVDFYLHKEMDWTIFMLCILLILMQISNFFIKSSLYFTLKAFKYISVIVLYKSNFLKSFPNIILFNIKKKKIFYYVKISYFTNI